MLRSLKLPVCWPVIVDMGTNNDLCLNDFSFFQPLADGMFLLWSVDKCEACGGECEAPNSVNIGIRQGKKVLVRIGLKERTLDGGELGWCDKLDGAVCPDCYKE